MKKTYINPELQVIKIETQQIIAASIGMGSGDKSPSGADGRFFEDIEDFQDFDMNDINDFQKLLGM